MMAAPVQRLARARLADDAQDLTGRNLERNVVEGDQGRVPRRKLDAQVSTFRAAQRSSASHFAATSGGRATTHRLLVINLHREVVRQPVSFTRDQVIARAWRTAELDRALVAVAAGRGRCGTLHGHLRTPGSTSTGLNTVSLPSTRTIRTGCVSIEER